MGNTEKYEETDKEERIRWSEIMKKPEREFQEGRELDFSVTLSQEHDDRDHENCKSWKVLFALIDLWTGQKSWYAQLRFSDLEILIEDLVSRRD